MKRAAICMIAFAACVLTLMPGRDRPGDARLKKSFRRAAQHGWTYVHLEGSPAEIGFQHGYHLAPEIEDLLKVIALGLTHDSDADYNFYRSAAQKVFWPQIEQEYREELQGIVQGLNARGVKLDIWDVVVMNASLELNPYYKNWYDREHQTRNAKKAATGDHCSAFVATGRYTKDGKMVMAHNNWSGYLDGQRWSIIFDMAPAAGHRFLMDGLPGWIHSGDDFG
ncbi:MAG TPA: hypothetical protein VM120_04210, partial [Bryobacteraceae bacterium]|nr:hypothetical protein [Bryobacteraceae bacterium]